MRRTYLDLVSVVSKEIANRVCPPDDDNAEATYVFTACAILDLPEIKPYIRGDDISNPRDQKHINELNATIKDLESTISDLHKALITQISQTKATCKTCGQQPSKIPAHFEECTDYVFNTGCYRRHVITNAKDADFKKATDLFGTDDYCNDNIEDILIKLGFIAITASHEGNREYIL